MWFYKIFFIVFFFTLNLVFFLMLNNINFYLPYRDYLFLFMFFLLGLFCLMFYYGSSFQLKNNKKRKPRGVCDASGLFRIYKGYFKDEYYYLGIEPISSELLPADLKKNPEDIKKFILECLQTTGVYTQMRPYYGMTIVSVLCMLGYVALLLRMMNGALFRAS